ncbi:MAG: chaperonin GroEL, partial [Candidatus Hydrogenedentes bacterium]|nr:chaperonin GroEL [Candidatus Hydrogenedentota bacterium]
VIADQVATGKSGWGYNAATDKMEDMVKSGILDPAKVIRAAIQNAVSVAAMMLTTTCMVADIPEKEKKSPGGGPGMGMPGGEF